MQVKPYLLRSMLMAALVVGPLSARAADGDGAKTLPLRKVVLFTSGVGYFQRDGKVNDNVRLELKFKTGDVNDLLKSLVLRDFNGGQVSSVTYSSRDPFSRTLKSFPIDLTDNPSLFDLLKQVRGEKVELAAPTPVSGTVVGVEKKKTFVDNGKPERFVEVEMLTLLTAEGLRRIPLDQVQQIRFVRKELQADFVKALAVLATSHDTQKKTVAIQFTGKGTRRVLVGYISESPMWKTSYRLALNGEKNALLQGWAIVENTSDEDWQNVDLTLVSGRPISFRMDLYQPLYVPRPEVQPELFRTLLPQKHEEAMEKDEKPGFAGRRFPAAPRAAAGYLKKAQRDAFADKLQLAEGVSALARGGTVGELFRYAIEKPVTIPRHKSAMLPIINANIQTQRVSLYNQALQKKHPLNAVRLKNTSGLHLMQGPITLFDDSTYAGDAQIANLSPGSERLISYALDLQVEVEPIAEEKPQQLVSVKLSKGTLITVHKLRRVHLYKIRNRAGKQRRVLIEQPFQADWKLVMPEKPSERTRDVYRFAVDVKANDKGSLQVTEERSLSQQVAFSNVPDSTIVFYLRSPEVGKKMKEALSKLQKMKHELSLTLADRRRKESRVEEIGKEQDRIRKNMERLPKESELYARYVKTFVSQEDELVSLRKQIKALRDKEATQQKTLDEYLMSLDLE